MRSGFVPLMGSERSRQSSFSSGRLFVTRDKSSVVLAAEACCSASVRCFFFGGAADVFLVVVVVVVFVVVVVVVVVLVAVLFCPSFFLGAGRFLPAAGFADESEADDLGCAAAAGIARGLAALPDFAPLPNSAMKLLAAPMSSNFLNFAPLNPRTRSSHSPHVSTIAGASLPSAMA